MNKRANIVKYNKCLSGDVVRKSTETGVQMSQKILYQLIVSTK